MARVDGFRRSGAPPFTAVLGTDALSNEESQRLAVGNSETTRTIARLDRSRSDGRNLLTSWGPSTRLAPARATTACPCRGTTRSRRPGDRAPACDFRRADKAG